MAERTKYPSVDDVVKDAEALEDIEEVSERVYSGPLIPTGSTLLNLACSDSATGGYAAGTLINIIGDSQSGKSFVALTMCAELIRDERFKDYRIIYDDAEQACNFNLEKLFGKKLVEQIEAPHTTDDAPAYSDTIQDFFTFIFDAIDDGRPFIYILDSLDALTSDEEINKVEDMIEAKRKGKDVKGDYGMSKPKTMSQILRTIVTKLKNTDSLLIVISQTRDNINPMSFEKKTRSGGRALKFFASHEMWMAVVGKLKAKERIIGVNVEAKITKNKLTGKIRKITFPILYEYGIDDIASMLDFLIDEGIVKKEGKGYNFEELGLKGLRNTLISEIEQSDTIEELREIVVQVWKDIEEDLKKAIPHKKQRYDD